MPFWLGNSNNLAQLPRPMIFGSTHVLRLGQTTHGSLVSHSMQQRSSAPFWGQNFYDWKIHLT